MSAAPRLLSVVVPCRDAAATLAGALAALAGQEAAVDWEVVVADNGSRDSSRAIAESFRGRLPGLRVVDAADRTGAAHARNAGAAAATGGFLLFCDADDEVAPGWLAAMAGALAAHPFVASRFELRRLNPGWLGARLTHPQESGLNPYTYPRFLPHAGGSGLGVWRERHQAIGGFDESLPALEDTDYCWRLQLAGTPLVFVPEAVVHVRLPVALGGHFRQMRSYGEYNVCLYRRYRARGMPRLGLLPGFLRWGRLLLGLPRLLTRRGRVEWISQLGWRLGRLRGCLEYRVLAP